MKRLTESEILSYIKQKNTKTGVYGIDRNILEKIDKDSLLELSMDGNLLKDNTGKALFKFDSFPPKANSIYLKPSFAGRQIVLGIVEDRIIFSDGVWFACH